MVPAGIYHSRKKIAQKKSFANAHDPSGSSEGINQQEPCALEVGDVL